MRSARYFWFVLSILTGLLIGLVLGNRLWPMPYENLSINSLRDDYKADYVLMVAETYHQDQNLKNATDFVQRLGPEAPVYLAQQAMLTARNLNYPSQDIELMVQLVQALQKVAPTVEGTP
ncbi:MAG: hypothetical protein LWX83_01145 [Anaerolineae bacterium]|nr:hypothetical protein [Anaerolineae bacterium]